MASRSPSKDDAKVSFRALRLDAISWFPSFLAMNPYNEYGRGVPSSESSMHRLVEEMVDYKVWSVLVKHVRQSCWRQSKTTQSLTVRGLSVRGSRHSAKSSRVHQRLSCGDSVTSILASEHSTLYTTAMTLSTTAQQDPSPLPLALIKKRTLLPSLSARAPFASCASMTKCFLAKAFPSPPKKLWGYQSSPTGVDDPTEASTGSTEQDDEAARGDICEIIVVAIQKVTDSSSDAAEEQDRTSIIGPGKLNKSAIWGSAKWSQGQLQLPHRVACTVRSGATTKVSTQPERNDNEFAFDEKFVFERRENDAQYHEVTIEVSGMAPGFGRMHRLGQVAVDLDAAFAAQTAGPIYRHSALTMQDGSDSSLEIHYVLHRLVVQNATAAAASRVLTRSSTSLNDDDDMDACGQIFPDLWYLC